jgi:hypothetical protein
MPTRKRTRAQRTESKLRRILEHQRCIEGIEPVYELKLEEHLMDDALYPVSVYMAKPEPIIQGYPRDSQTAIAMQYLESWGAENARL